MLHTDKLALNNAVTAQHKIWSSLSPIDVWCKSDHQLTLIAWEIKEKSFCLWFPAHFWCTDTLYSLNMISYICEIWFFSWGPWHFLSYCLLLLGQILCEQICICLRDWPTGSLQRCCWPQTGFLSCFCLILRRGRRVSVNHITSRKKESKWGRKRDRKVVEGVGALMRSTPVDFD